MTIKATLFDNRHSKLYDISEVIGGLKIKTQLSEQPGKCTFDLVKANGIAFWEGATVSITIDGVDMFKGFVVTKERSEDVNIIKVTCLDQMFYLKNKDSRVFKNVTSSQIFSSLCTDFVLKHKVVHASSYVCPPRINDAKTLYEMMKYALDQTLIATGTMFIIRDNFGTLEHVNVLNLHSGKVLGDASGVISFTYKTSIESDVYNQIVLYRDNEKTKKRELYIVNDTINSGQNIKEWGILQLYESVDESLNKAQLSAMAEGMLKLYNSKVKTLKLKVVGVPSIFAGSLIGCKIADLGDIALNATLLVEVCEHEIGNGEHYMNLDVKVMV